MSVTFAHHDSITPQVPCQIEKHDQVETATKTSPSGSANRTASRILGRWARPPACSAVVLRAACPGTANPSASNRSHRCPGARRQSRARARGPAWLCRIPTRRRCVCGFLWVARSKHTDLW